MYVFVRSHLRGSAAMRPLTLLVSTYDVKLQVKVKLLKCGDLVLSRGTVDSHQRRIHDIQHHHFLGVPPKIILDSGRRSPISEPVQVHRDS